jgi:hypothetical protein
MKTAINPIDLDYIQVIPPTYDDVFQGEDRLDKIFSPWECGSSRLWSLLDLMEKYEVDKLCAHMRTLQYLEHWILEGIESTGDPNMTLSGEQIAIISPQLNALLSGLKSTELIAAPLLIERLLRHLAGLSLVRLHEQVITLPNMIEVELKDILFLYIPKDHAVWFNKNDPFGSKVSNNFPSTMQDIKDACNCYAIGQYTACIFHLMRVAEIGLRILAWDRRIKFKKKSPLELKEWREIFKGLEDEEIRLKSLHRTKAREAQFEFYHGAMIELRAFKNLYRDRTMHARACYDIYQTTSAMVNVSAFMKGLSEKISESNRTPLNWT